ncbi:hypothetical protein C8R47DRAFT_175215 [Mycena vitilis]|nr:hypothetical protein C8R47DRAFT_175215 [Mycena vitilis]
MTLVAHNRSNRTTCQTTSAGARTRYTSSLVAVRRLNRPFDAPWERGTTDTDLIAMGDRVVREDMYQEIQEHFVDLTNDPNVDGVFELQRLNHGDRSLPWSRLRASHLFLNVNLLKMTAGFVDPQLEEVSETTRQEVWRTA